MKKVIGGVIIGLTFVFASLTMAGSIPFQWDANIESDLAGYRVYRSQVSGQYSAENIVGDIPCGPNDEGCCTFTDENVPDGLWSWVATAYDTEGNESNYSEEITKVVDFTPPEQPKGFIFYQVGH